MEARPESQPQTKDTQKAAGHGGDVIEAKQGVINARQAVLDAIAAVVVEEEHAPAASTEDAPAVAVEDAAALEGASTASSRRRRAVFDSTCEFHTEYKTVHK